jgi:endonuclease/exonuclease/phosphatase family metal-dependent hydrolase
LSGDTVNSPIPRSEASDAVPDARLPTATNRIFPSRVPVVRHAFTMWRLFRRWFSRRELTVRLLGLPLSEGTADEPGLILLQIDGFSRRELERAIEQSRMPFLRQLTHKEGYRLHTLYSGQPATTPAVLGELFYGVQQAVPAFSFRDHRTSEVVEMLGPEIAAVIQGELQQQGEGLLKHGSAYCDIYSGGAAESSFCPADMRWHALANVSVWKRAAILLMNLSSLVRMLGMLCVELILAVVDCFRSEMARREFVHELKFIPRRLLGAIAVRESTAIGVEADAIRGLPIIHANFVGYDELAHRRGPDSEFAHRGLPDIDRALRRIWNAAHGSHRRNYHVWIMSDHGQERTVPYDQEFGRGIAEAVADVHNQSHDRGAISSKPGNGDERADQKGGPTVVAVGPLGYIYCTEPLTSKDVERIAPKLVHDARIPLVLAKVDEEVVAWTADGRFRMPEEADRVLATGHPHLTEVAADLAGLCSHPDAGTFLVSGWRNSGTPLTFVAEHGSHGGPGPLETSGFLMLPSDARLVPDQPLRPGSLRRMVQDLFRIESGTHALQWTPASRLRLVTYNVHSCIGLDGRLSPSRIARVLAALEPDVVALQELDVGRSRSGSLDQAELIARELQMELHFHPAIDVVGERYGDAILSRVPMKLVKASLLPGHRNHREPRGALWVKLDLGDQSLDVVNTHLGLSRHERMEQIEALVGPEWLRHPQMSENAILCGDLNSSPRSPAYRRMMSEMRDALTLGASRRPARTWFSPLPLARIDHVFVSEGIEVLASRVPRTRLSHVASDHLPVVVDVQLRAG